MHFLIVKHGALGDVVRTSYFAKALKDKHSGALRLSWLTSPDSAPLLRFNPYIDDLWTERGSAPRFRFDLIFSLDDEHDVLEFVRGLDSNRVVGAFLDHASNPTYSADSAGWFDMGLLSRFGKARADALKVENRRSHAEIFSQLFAVEGVTPHFFPNVSYAGTARGVLGEYERAIGINPFAGGRWKSKELPADELKRLASELLRRDPGAAFRLVLIGAGQDRQRNLQLAEELSDERIVVARTDDSVLKLAALIASLDHLVTSDSLAMHLAIAQGVPFTAFFAPTSAAEIDDFGRGSKVISTAPDYCSYRRDADNSSLTADRILECMTARRQLSR